MEERKWQELNQDCLVKIFERVGVEALIHGVPFVCKSWYQPTLDPDCWKILDLQLLLTHIFPTMDEDIPYFRFEKIHFECIKFVVDRSRGGALSVSLPYDDCSVEALEYIVNGCPALKILKIPRGSNYYHNIPQLIPKWKILETLDLGEADRDYSFTEILTQINIHCKNFTSLYASRGSIDHEEVFAITSLIPKIKHLTMCESFISRESLMLILSVCKHLELLDVRDSIGFEENDAEILSMASYIKKFDSKGAQLDDFDDDDDGRLCSRDVDFGGYDSDRW